MPKRMLTCNMVLKVRGISSGMDSKILFKASAVSSVRLTRDKFCLRGEEL